MFLLFNILTSISEEKCIKNLRKTAIAKRKTKAIYLKTYIEVHKNLQSIHKVTPAICLIQRTERIP